MTEIETELRDLSERLHRTQAKLRRLTLALAGGAVALVAGGTLFHSRVALSDPPMATACGHSSQLYCFAAGTPALASQVNSNFESTFEAVDTKFDKAGGTVTGNLTVTGTANAAGVTATNVTSTNSSATNAGVTNSLTVGQTVTAATLVLSGSSDQPLTHITTCNVTPPGVAANNSYTFQDLDCTHGAPKGNCVGWISRQQGCGQFTQASLHMPQEGQAAYIYWYNLSQCGNANFVATYLCSQ